MQPASTTSRAANALKTGVVYGGTALLSGVNAITPHLAGAVDIMVVEQPDGSYKSSPFYVRFGKYTHLRSKDRRVNITINGEPAPFHMHLGAYGTAYFTAESTELVDEDEEQQSILAGMMSPPSGYSSGDEERPGYPHTDMLLSVCEEVAHLPATQPHDNVSSPTSSGPRSPAPISLGTTATGSVSSPTRPHTAPLHQRMEGVGSGPSHPSPPLPTSPDSQGEAGGRSRPWATRASSLGLPPSTLGVGPPAASPPTPLLSTAAAALPTLAVSVDAAASKGGTAGTPGAQGLDGVEGRGYEGEAEAAGAGAGAGPGWVPECAESLVGAKLGLLTDLPCPQPQPQQDSAAQLSAWDGLNSLAACQEQQQQEAAGSGGSGGCGTQVVGGASVELSSTCAPEQQAPQHGVMSQAQASTSSALHLQEHATHTSTDTPAAGAPACPSPAPSPSLTCSTTPADPKPEGKNKVQGQQATLTAAQPGSNHHPLQGPAATLDTLLVASSSQGATPQLPGVQLPADAAGWVGPPSLEGALVCEVRDLGAEGTGTQVLVAAGEIQEAGAGAGVGAGEGGAAGAGEAAGEACPGSEADDPLAMELPEGVGLQSTPSLPLCPSPPPPAVAVASGPAPPTLPSHPLSPADQAPSDMPDCRRQGDQALPLPIPTSLPPLLKPDQEGEQSGSCLAASPPCCSSPPVGSSILDGYLGDVDKRGPSVMSHSHSQAPHSKLDLGHTVEGGGHAVQHGKAGRRVTGVPAGQVSLSMCGALLQPQQDWEEAVALFDQHLISSQMFADKGAELLASPHLMVQLQHTIYPWSAAAPLVLGSCLFGSTWPHLLPPGTPCWQAPGAAAALAMGAMASRLSEAGGGQQQGQGAGAGAAHLARTAAQEAQGPSLGEGLDEAGTAKQSAFLAANSSSWRLWPFRGWRERGPPPHPSPSCDPRLSPDPVSGQLPANSPPLVSLHATSSPALLSTAMQSSAAQGRQRQTGGERAQQQGPALPPSHPPHPHPPHHHSHPHGSGGMEVGPWTSPGLQALGDPAAQGSLDSAASGSGRLLHGLQSGASAGSGGAGSRSQVRAQWERGGSSERLARQQSLAMSRKTLSPSPGQLGLLRLREGQNSIRYKVGSSELVAFIYFYRWSVKLVISDIDGTITRSDVLGHLLPAMGWDWSHAGISRLFTDITSNKYQIMYLSSRSISQANITRDYINSLVQGKHRMPLGPVIISPHGLLPSLYREMILRRPHEFKIATLLDIRSLFPPDWNPFYAGFGNRDTDEISYREVGVPLGRIFIINPKGELRRTGLAVQSSTWGSLPAVNELVDQIFPPIARLPPRTALAPPALTPPAAPPSTPTTTPTAATPAPTPPTAANTQQHGPGRGTAPPVLPPQPPTGEGGSGAAAGAAGRKPDTGSHAQGGGAGAAAGNGAAPGAAGGAEGSLLSWASPPAAISWVMAAAAAAVGGGSSAPPAASSSVVSGGGAAGSSTPPGTAPAPGAVQQPVTPLAAHEPPTQTSLPTEVEVGGVGGAGHPPAALPGGRPTSPPPASPAAQHPPSSTSSTSSTSQVGGMPACTSPLAPGTAVSLPVLSPHTAEPSSSSSSSSGGTARCSPVRGVVEAGSELGQAGGEAGVSNVGRDGCPGTQQAAGHRADAPLADLHTGQAAAAGHTPPPAQGQLLVPPLQLLQPPTQGVAADGVAAEGAGGPAAASSSSSSAPQVVGWSCGVGGWKIASDGPSCTANTFVERPAQQQHQEQQRQSVREGQAASCAGVASAAALPQLCSSPAPSSLQLELSLLAALQASEEYNDLAFWREDPSAFMAGGGVDELQKLLAAPSPAPAPSNLRASASRARSGGSAPDKTDSCARTPDKGSAQRYPLQSAVEQDTGSDFLSQYNPFAY